MSTLYCKLTNTLLQIKLTCSKQQFLCPDYRCQKMKFTKLSLPPPPNIFMMMVGRQNNDLEIDLSKLRH